MATSLDYHQAPSSFASMPHRRPLPTGANPQFGAPPAASSAQSSPYQTYSANMQIPPALPPQSASRRTLSNATSSTSASYNVPSVNRPNSGGPSSYSSSIRRSTSSRSGASQGPPSSYVALLRKQKATVWCDRAQHEDPRLLAQQRAAKVRAQAEMVGGAKPASTAGKSNNSSGGGITGGVRSKIRHHGAVKASAYSGGLGAPGNLSGAGVPMRLSASEVDDEQNSDNGEDALDRRYHQRNGSGRSSLGSHHRSHSGYFSVNGVTPNPTAAMVIRTRSNNSNGSTPPGTSPVETRRNSLPLSRHQSATTPISTQEETPMPDGQSSRNDYFEHAGGSGGSGGSLASEERFGEASSLHSYGAPAPPATKKTADDLRRRGSVDDRTATMSGVRLFVANPDMDSD